MGWLGSFVNRLFAFKAEGLAANLNLFSSSAKDDVDAYIARIATRHIKNAVLLAKVNAPVLTSKLRDSIKAIATEISGSNVTVGLESDVIYARRQEFTHATRSFYMLRALTQVDRELQQELNEARGLSDIILRVKSAALFTNPELENHDVIGE